MQWKCGLFFFFFLTNMKHLIVAVAIVILQDSLARLLHVSLHHFVQVDGLTNNKEDDVKCDVLEVAC